MTIELWGLGGTFYLGLPSRAAGYGLLILEMAALGWLLVRARRRSGGTSRRGPAAWVGVLALALLAPVFAQTFLIRMEGAAAVVPGVPKTGGGALWAWLGAVPWLVAGGLFGVAPAALVAGMGGLARGGFGTLRLLTPFSFALSGAVAAALLRQSYQGLPARWARRPLFAGLVASLMLGLLGVAETFVYSGGDLLDALVFALESAGPVLLAGVLEGAAGGLVTEAVAYGLRGRWGSPRSLETAPYNRSLAARLTTMFVVLGLAAAALTGYGAWLLAHDAAQEMAAEDMRRTTAQASEVVPFFVQTGRALAREAAEALSESGLEGQTLDAWQAWLRRTPFFQRLEVYAPDGRLVLRAPEGPTEATPRPLEVALETALQGVPQEVVLTGEAGAGAQVVFLSPAVGPSGQVTGVVAGWSDLSVNPLLTSLSTILAGQTRGQAFVTDERGVVLFPPGEEMAFVYDAEASGEVRTELAPDGSRRLLLLEEVAGYPWRVVVIVPEREVNRVALGITLRLVALIAGVGVLALATVYVLSRRLTSPLERMAAVAQAIARGRLDEKVEVPAHEDEIGRLAVAFESMRRSLRARLAEMSLLLRAGQRLAASLHPAESVPPILEDLRSHYQAAAARLVLTDAGQEVYAAGAEAPWSALDGAVATLAAERGAFSLENAARARAVLGLETPPRSLQAIHAWPVVHEGRALGALWLGFDTPQGLGEEKGLASILADQLAVAVAKARLFQRAEEERLRLSAVLQSTPDAVLVVDGQGRLSLANPAAEVVLRIPPQKAQGRPVAECVAAEPLLALLTRPGDDPRTAEVPVRGGRTYFATLRPIDPVGGQGWVCVLWDITHYKQLDMLKSEFVSTVSHDLRSPLTLMRGYTTMLATMGALDEQQKEFVRKIANSIEQMNELVDNLLDLGRLEAGVPLEYEEVAPEELLHRVLSTNRPKAIAKQQTLKVELADDMAPVMVDPTLMAQAVSNLLDNAIKYTPSRGTITLRAWQEGEDQVVEVADTGLGIAPADQARLFEKFYRARRPETLRTRGTGLGLAIVKSIVEQHGGEVTVRSRLGEGSTFTLRFPVRPRAGAQEEPSRTLTGGSRSV